MPIDENTVRATIAQGGKAGSVLDNEQFKNAIQTVRDGAVRAFKSANPSDQEALLRARMQFDVVEQIVNALHKVLSDGKIAQNRLDDILAAKELEKHGGQPIGNRRRFN